MLPNKISESGKTMETLEKINELVKTNGGMVKTNELTSAGIDYKAVLELVESGELVRIKSGYYTVKSMDFSEEELITAMFPDGILTMESALYYIGYLPNRPYEWRIAISKNTSKSRFKIEYPIVTPYYTEPESMSFGVTTIEIAGKEMQMYDLDRLICEVMKYQEKMDREDFKKAVLTYIQDDRKNVANLMEYARERKVLKKVQNIIGVWL